jgi:hypothetical protein
MTALTVVEPSGPSLACTVVRVTVVGGVAMVAW